MMKIIDGKKLAGEIRARLTKEVTDLSGQPGLAIILVGDDTASHTYVSLKEKAAKEIGIHFEKHLFPATVTQQEIIERIQQLNNTDTINGMLVQLPLPRGIDENIVITSIDPTKDVDGFHKDNIAHLLSGTPGVVPGLAAGIVRLAETTDVVLSGAPVMIYANNPIFSDPLEYLFNQKGAKTVTCHPSAEDCLPLAQQADIVVVAVGRPKFITESMIKRGVVLIDVGFNEVDGTVVGDVDVDSVKNKAGWLTPVPGGVGPMTVAMLLENVILAFMRQQ